MWYRAPEILLRCGEYSKPCDSWAVGCILGEFLNKGRPILPGDSEVDQFKQICGLIGKPCQTEDWPEYFELSNCEHYQKLSSNLKNNIADNFRHCPPNCIDLLQKLLCWDPAKRITMNEALLHPFFTSSPLPVFP